MVTKDQALTAREFHYGRCKRMIGPRGGLTIKIESWRRNGTTQTWKTRPEAFRVPIKFGLYAYGEITERTAGDFHAADDPTCGAAEPISVQV